jgi:uncharacterized protein
MTWEQAIGLAAALLVMSVGAVGSFLPGVPTSILVLAAALGHRLYFGAHGPATIVLVLIGALMAFSMAADYLATMAGAKKLGATWRGVTGAFLGTIIGLFFNLPGLLLGPFVGAILLEMLGGRKWREATKAGVGAILGLLLGAVGKLACCLASMALFTVNVILRSGTAG